MDRDQRFAAPRNSAGPAPLRRPHSIRRTSSIDTVWPEGREGAMRMTGRARDAVTSSGGSPRVVAEDSFLARVGWDRTIQAIEAAPGRAAIGKLVGARGGGHLRKILDELIPEERTGATPLHLILDDLSGASLVAGWAWSRWIEDWHRRMSDASDPPIRPPHNMAGVCIGFRPGSAALGANGMPAPGQNAQEVEDLRNPADPEGWHVFTDQTGAVGMRRARRIDVWRDGVIHVDSAFQDSATNREGGRSAIHEYRLVATADPQSLEILSLEPDPRVLPYAECPSAVVNARRMVGARLPELRERVLAELRGTAGCTHLNDALRALAEVPALAARLI